jgi:hypothetical protein
VLTPEQWYLRHPKKEETMTQNKPKYRDAFEGEDAAYIYEISQVFELRKLSRERSLDVLAALAGELIEGLQHDHKRNYQDPFIDQVLDVVTRISDSRKEVQK